MNELGDDEFARSVAYFWTEKGDPTRFAGWDEDRCRRVMPSFYKAWRDYQSAESVLNHVARNYSN